ncbi:hypothetical protein PYH37_002275 [Sinorhizobium numidicum]|uniref:Transmembrane protein n=1 Tax=Sinorhizobium numidicum TaxID=680248 RepID=A0ABY8CZS0_9HYPH|nr:hypothetical protein [Sinorhizobium numidicum]WEX77478.1 hypothetical protein PYH37_002275 [Sinorhizobium numidicum]WEX84138.1 hypothetical protein PYH38_002988 [Sinorhizobium numidicum]
MAIHRTATFVLAIGTGTFALFWSGVFLPERPADLVSQAEARIGRPLTPISYAGVARRTTRRAVYAGAAAATYYAPACVPVRDAYGNIISYRCP